MLFSLWFYFDKMLLKFNKIIKFSLICGLTPPILTSISVWEFQIQVSPNEIPYCIFSLFEESPGSKTETFLVKSLSQSIVWAEPAARSDTFFWHHLKPLFFFLMTRALPSYFAGNPSTFGSGLSIKNSKNQ